MAGRFGDDGGGSATFGAGESNETTLASGGETDGFLARYNSDGTLAWAKSLCRGPGDDHLQRMCVAGDGTLWVTGAFESTCSVGYGDPNQTELTAAGSLDMFLGMFDPAGALVWAKQAGGTDETWGNGVAVLPDWSVVVIGHFSGQAEFGAGEPNETLLTSVDGYDIYLAKYDATGSLLWATRAGDAGADAGINVGALSDGSMLVTGYFSDAAVFVIVLVTIKAALIDTARDPQPVVRGVFVNRLGLSKISFLAGDSIQL